MTEPIIINGVDVSGCPEYRDLSSRELKKKYHSISCLGYSAENCRKSDCKDNPNCYYKQLQRKTAEYEEYKKNYSHSNADFQQERNAVADLAFESNKYKRKLQIATEALEKVIKCQEGLPTAKRIAHTTLERIKK